MPFDADRRRLDDRSTLTASKLFVPRLNLELGRPKEGVRDDVEAIAGDVGHGDMRVVRERTRRRMPVPHRRDDSGLDSVGIVEAVDQRQQLRNVVGLALQRGMQVGRQGASGGTLAAQLQEFAPV